MGTRTKAVTLFTTCIKMSRFLRLVILMQWPCRGNIRASRQTHIINLCNVQTAFPHSNIPRQKTFIKQSVLDTRHVWIVGIEDLYVI